jgi:iron(III) transport system substrate-binding protein
MTMYSPRRLGLGFTVGLTAVLACACSSSSSSGTGSASSPAAGASSAPSSPSADLGSPQAQQAMNALYAKAVAAGQTSVVIYGPSAGTDTQEYNAFKQAFPKISISGVPIVGPPMDTRIAAEASSGKHIADLAYTGGSGMMNYYNAGYFTPYKPVTLPSPAALAPQSLGPGNSFVGLTISVAGVVTNSNTVKTPPKEWTDLEGSDYKNQIAMYDPTALGLMSDNFAHLSRVPKYAQLESALKANSAQLFPSSSLTGPLTAVAQGAKKVAIGTPYNFYLQAKGSGAPVTFSLFNADNYWTTLYAGVLKGAPHPLAAELYEDWMLTPAGTKAISQEGLYSTVTGSAAPAGLPALSAVPLQAAIPLAQLAQADNEAVAKAKQYWGS